MRSFPGLLKQIEYEEILTKDLKDFNWEQKTFLDRTHKKHNIQKLPFIFNNIFGRKLFAWIWLLQNSNKYDYVIMRHMEFDPFALIFSWFVPNRILVHHAKESEELKVIRNNLFGFIASRVEKLTGRIAAQTSSALICVMKEIIEYQREVRKLPIDFPIFLYPNGVIVEKIPLIKNSVKNLDEIEIGFIAGTFSPWHGLDILLNECIEYSEKIFKEKIILNLIGKVDSKNKLKSLKLNNLNRNIKVIIHGRLDQKEYQKILSKCNLGIGSLAMYRTGVKEGATLKVREMLAMGLPVYSGHVDTALPDEFPFYKNNVVKLKNIIDFAKATASFTPKEIREASYPFISKHFWLKILTEDIKKLYLNNLNQ